MLALNNSLRTLSIYTIIRNFIGVTVLSNKIFIDVRKKLPLVAFIFGVCRQFST